MRINLSSKNYADFNKVSEGKKDTFIIFPGGGYHMTSNREAGPIAKRLEEHGFHTVVYYYREEKLIYPNTILEVYELLKILKNDTSIGRIFVIGFSAGGHLALNTMTSYKNLISGGILAYPVVSTDPDSIHEGSFENLLQGNNQYLNEVSLEKQITRKMMPMFIWHTEDDGLVSVNNSYKLANKLEMTKTKYELLIYKSGPHGLSLATEDVTFDDMDSKEFVSKYGHMSDWFEKSMEFIKEI